MNKYDTSVQLKDNNSLAYVISKIKPGSSVLEFGPATGYMTQYLKENKQCKVSIVEIDEGAYDKAIHYAEDGICGNIEEGYWIEFFTDRKFDYITFADVLEHLSQPENVLLAAKEFLKEDGKILISIPNIAHNAVIIDLFNNKFQYRDTGILDNTHLRFFTYDAVCGLIKRCGLFIQDASSVRFGLDYVGFGNSFDEVPGNIKRELLLKKYGFVNQFLFSVGKNEEDYCDLKEVISWKSYLYFDTGSNFNETNKICANAEYQDQCFKIEFDLSKIRAALRYRVDLCDFACVVNDLQIKLDETIINNFLSNSVSLYGYNYFLSDHPYISLEEINRNVINKITVTGKLSNLQVNDAVRVMEQMDSKYLKTIMDLEVEIGRLNDTIDLKDKCLSEEHYRLEQKSSREIHERNVAEKKAKRYKWKKVYVRKKK